MIHVDVVGYDGRVYELGADEQVIELREGSNVVRVDRRFLPRMLHEIVEVAARERAARRS